MNCISKRLCFLALTALVTSSLVALAAAPKKKADFVSMFDGKTLDGWEATPATTAAAWTVQDGMIVGDGDKGRGYLTYTGNKQAADLEMHFCYRFPGKGNSGVSIRAIKDDTGRRDFQSYHADIGHLGIGKNVMGAWDFHTPAVPSIAVSGVITWSLIKRTSPRSRPSRMPSPNRTSTRATGTRCESSPGETISSFM